MNIHIKLNLQTFSFLALDSAATNGNSLGGGGGGGGGAGSLTGKVGLKILYLQLNSLYTVNENFRTVTQTKFIFIIAKKLCSR